MSTRKPSQQPERVVAPRMIVLALCMVVVILAGIIVALALRPVKVVSTFDQCKDAGGALLEIYPEQCVIGSTTFTNIKQHANSNVYVGMTEKAALAKAKQDSIPARVVERDGAALPVTLDFAFGRHNLYVRDDLVYKVEVEGQATDSPHQE